MKKFKVSFSLLDKNGGSSTGGFVEVIETKSASDAKRLIEIRYPNARGISVSEVK